jgi:hypothetical protein
MKPISGYYCLIQYCPDASRQEFANVGVVLFCPEPFFLKARTARGNQRIRRFFQPDDPDWDQINLLKNSIERRLTVDREQFRDLAALERFAATRANAMRLSAPRPIAVEEPEADLDRLFVRLVGERSRKGAARVRRLLDRTFQAEGVAPYIQRNLTVTLPVFQRVVRVPFGFQNSRFRLIQATCFRGLTAATILKRAGKYALKGALLYNAPDPTLGDLQLIVVGQFAASQAEVARTVGRLLEKNHTELYRLDELDKLVEVIRSTGVVS